MFRNLQIIRCAEGLPAEIHKAEFGDFGGGFGDEEDATPGFYGTVFDDRVGGVCGGERGKGFFDFAGVFAVERVVVDAREGAGYTSVIYRHTQICVRDWILEGSEGGGTYRFLNLDLSRRI